MKKFFILKLFLLVSCVCLANIDKYTPNFKAVIHNKRSGYSVTNCSALSCPLLDYPSIFSIKNKIFMGNLKQFRSIKSKNLIKALKKFRALLEKFEAVIFPPDLPLKEVSGLVFTYGDEHYNFKIDLKKEITSALREDVVINEMGIRFKDAKLRFISTDRDRVRVKVPFVVSDRMKSNYIEAFLAINKQKRQVKLKQLHYVNDKINKNVLGDPQSDIVFGRISSGPQRAECFKDHSILPFVLLIKTIADSQLLPKLSFFEGIFPSVVKGLRARLNKSKEHFLNSSIDCEICSKEINGFKTYIKSKNECRYEGNIGPCPLFSSPDCTIINNINDRDHCLAYFRQISDLPNNPDYLKNLVRIMRKILAIEWPSINVDVTEDILGGGNCVNCCKSFEKVFNIIDKNLVKEISKLQADFAELINWFELNESCSKSLQQVVIQRFEKQHLNRYLEQYGVKCQPAQFYTLLGYDSPAKFIAASSKDVVQKIELIRKKENLSSDDDKSKFLKQMDNLINNLLSKQLLDEYLKYKAGDKTAFNGFTFNQPDSSVIKEFFKKINILKQRFQQEEIFAKTQEGEYLSSMID